MQTALSMSRVSDEALSAEGAEVARLVRLTLRGDVTAFEQIILRYESRVMALAARLLGCKDDARDAAQEVFLRAFKYLHRADPQKPLEPWLFRIAVNVCRDTAAATTAAPEHLRERGAGRADRSVRRSVRWPRTEAAAPDSATGA